MNEETSSCCGDEVLNENDGEGICAGCREWCEVFEDDEQASGPCLVVCHLINFSGSTDMTITNDIYLEVISDLHKLAVYENPYCKKLNFKKHSMYKEAALKIVDEIRRGDV